ncbi:MAG TPA: alpha/beta fold hydrolase [Thermoanaerobaculia bacterium]|nr:alpha/beta fold hydrolase [Thermoanaerobaculia bacterium]
MSFEATDGVRLSGLLFEPKRRSRRVIVFLHGTGGASVFEQRRTNILAEAFTRAGIAYFPFDNRGSQIVRRLRKKKRSTSGGSAHERIRESIFDIDGAARFLRKRGYRELIVAGHSTGANKIAVYDHYRRRNPFRRYVLLAGADDTGLLYVQLGARRFRSALARARERRNSEELVPSSLSSQPMSWRAFYDMANPDGDYNVFSFLQQFKSRAFRYLSRIPKPALFVYGDHDEFLPPRAVEALAEAIGPKPNIEFAIMRDADHGFAGSEEDLAALILNWLSRDDRR